MKINHITGGGAEEPQVLQPVNGGEVLFVDPDVVVSHCRGMKGRADTSDPQEAGDPWVTLGLLGNQHNGSRVIAFALVIGIRRGKRRRTRQPCVMTDRDL